jgi:hypothetical protein
MNRVNNSCFLYCLDDDNGSSISINQHSSEVGSEEVEDIMPGKSEKKVERFHMN